jgi:phosphopantothenoylcysteine decarboxylase
MIQTIEQTHRHIGIRIPIPISPQMSTEKKEFNPYHINSSSNTNSGNTNQSSSISSSTSTSSSIVESLDQHSNASSSASAITSASASTRHRKHLLLALTGSVATIKGYELVGELTKSYDVRVLLSQRALFFIDREKLVHDNPSIGGGVYVDADEWRQWTRGDPVLHIELRKWADVFLIAPLSANTLAKLATGLNDNIVTCVARAWDIQSSISKQKPFIVAPAMNTMMYTHPFTNKQLHVLQNEFGITIIDPISKLLACGDIGIGAMESVDKIVQVVHREAAHIKAHSHN